MNLIHLIFSWVPVMIWARFIYHLSSIPSLNTGWGIWDLILRKSAHVGEFAMLTFLLLRALGRTWSQAVKTNLIVWAGILSILYAISDEFHQSFVPGRGPSVQDVIIDSVGVILVLIFFHKRTACHCEPEGRSNLPHL